MGLVGEKLSVETQILMKAPICDEDFLTRLIGPSTSQHKRESILVIIEYFNTTNRQRKDFYVEARIGKNHGEGQNSL